MDFKIGDRIRIYGTDKNLAPANVCATIADFTESGLIIVDEKSLAKCKVALWDFTLPHPKQCRKLKKREPKRLWILKANIKEQRLEEKPDSDFLSEFIEVLEVI